MIICLPLSYFISMISTSKLSVLPANGWLKFITTTSFARRGRGYLCGHEEIISFSEAFPVPESSLLLVRDFVQ